MPSRHFGASNPRKPHLVVGPGGLAAEIYDLRQDVDAAFGLLESGGFIRTDEFTNPIVADDDYFKAAFNGSTSAVVLRASAAGTFLFTTAPGGLAREISITRSNTPGAFSLGTIKVLGTCYGEQVTLNFVQANINGNDVLVSTERRGLQTIEEVQIPANALATGTFKIGFTNAFGLFGKPKSRAGLTAIFREVVNGALVDPPTATIDGRLYTAASAPNGTNDYALSYEVDPAG
jgi:hypothetical protein